MQNQNTSKKDAIINIHIKLNSCKDSSITKSVFKGFQHLAHRFCSEKYIKEETLFFIYTFVNNGNRKTLLENLFKDYHNAKKERQ